MPQEAVVPVIALSVWAALGAVIAVVLALKSRNIFDLRAAAILYYIVTYNVSGVAHLARLGGNDRGYFDLYASSSGIWGPVLLTLAGQVALTAPLLLVRERTTAVRIIGLTPSSRRWLFMLGLVLLPLTGAATVAMNRYAASVAGYRIISLTGGMARVGFFANWFVWAAAFTAIGILTSKFSDRHPVARLSTIAVFAIAVAWSLSWAGGRAEVILMVLTLAIAVWPLLTRGTATLAVIGFGVAGVVFSSSTLARRTQQYSVQGSSLGAVLDWQSGRFSMIGFAQDYVQQHGLLYGETILSGMLAVPLGVLKLLGISDGTSNLMSITQVTGSSLLRSQDLQYIVPGMTSEWYVNFGPIGAVGVYAGLGAVIALAQQWLSRSSDLSVRLGLSYLGLLLLFCTFSSQSGAIYNYAFFTGFPVVALLLVRVGQGAHTRQWYVVSAAPPVGGRKGNAASSQLLTGGV